MKTAIGSTLLILGLVTIALAQDPGWPRQFSKDGATLITYQPQVDSWNNFTDLDWRMAISLTPPAGKPAIGVAALHGQTTVNPEDDTVLISDLSIKSTSFPSLDAASAAQMEQLLKVFLPPTVSISMRRLVASVPKKEAAPGVPVRNDPPAIFVSNSPAILLLVEGQAILAPVQNAKVEFVVNTTWPLFRDPSNSQYYLLVDQQWMTASNLQGPWAPTAKLPKEMEKLPQDPQWTSLKNVIPARASKGTVPKVFYSSVPAEVILFNGPPIYSKIPGTQLTYVENTASDIFYHAPSQQYYYLIAGRWFRASSLQGPWSYATPNLPADFAQIPPNSPPGRVLASVPGTDEAKDAVLLAQIPTTLVVDPAAAAAQAKVTYSGEPQFKPIEGTSMTYATNTPDKVIKVGDVYYLCLQGVWFLSPSPQGPWTTASSVPSVIYTIPPSSPVYNVTYVTQTTTSSGSVEASHTAGYLGAFIIGATVGAIVANGNGYYYPPYIYRPPFGYPVYRPYPTTYGNPYYTSRGAYGISQTAYGPYGSATRAAQYNPYTGTSARGASVSTPYGSRSAAQAYNPYTGAYAATAQGSSPGAQWGSSVVSKGGQTAYGQHYSTAKGTVGSVQTSSGGRVAGASTVYGNAAVGKSASGDLYAGKDGNVYKNTGSGWQKYDNGSWNSVASPAPASPQAGARSTQQQRTQTAQQPAAATAQQQRTQAAQQRPTGGQAGAARQTPGGFSERSGGAAPAGLSQEAQNRQRGARESRSFQEYQRTGAGSTGARRSGGRRR